MTCVSFGSTFRVNKFGDLFQLLGNFIPLGGLHVLSENSSELEEGRELHDHVGICINEEVNRPDGKTAHYLALDLKDTRV